MTGTTIYHVHFNTSREDYYFGSLSAIYEDFTVDQIGISVNGLYNFGITPNKPYDNKKVTIKRGVQRRKKGKRKPGKKISRPTAINLNNIVRVNF